MNFIRRYRLLISIIIVLPLVMIFAVSRGGWIRINISTSGAEAPPYSVQSLVEYPISVSRFENTPPPHNKTKSITPETEITIDEVKDILTYASLVADCGEGNQTSDCKNEFIDMRNDFACKINLVAKFTDIPDSLEPTKIPTFNFPPGEPTEVGLEDDPNPLELLVGLLDCLSDGIICSQSDLEKVWSADQSQIKIVKEIKFCEGHMDQSGERFDACSEMGGQSIAITRRKDKGLEMEGILWLHEFGHNKHLWHTDDQSTVMHVPVAEESTKLSSEDCFMLREGQV